MTKTRRIKVLVIDNEVEFATTLTDRLRLRKIDATCVFSGEEAIETLASGDTPDVALIDIDLGDMNGLDLLPRIRAAKPGIALILLTGHGSVDAGILGMERGAADYLTKPVDLNFLLEKITEVYALAKKKG